MCVAIIGVRSADDGDVRLRRRLEANGILLDCVVFIACFMARA